MRQRDDLVMLDYQNEAVGLYSAFDFHVLCAMDMGLGKTLTTLKAMFDRKEDCFPALVVVPAGVKYNWVWEASHFFGIQSSICETRKTPLPDEQFGVDAPITVINYDILHFWAKWLAGQRFKTIVLDEAQNIANPTTKRSKAATYLGRGIAHRVALSGTPLLNRPKELFPICNFLWPKKFPDFRSFAERYCNPKWTRWGWDYDGASNVEELHARLREAGMIRYKKDVLKNLPKKIRKIVPIELSDEAEYKEASTDFLGWLKRTRADKVRSASKAEQLTRLGYLLRLTARLKLKGVVAWANQFLEETGEKLVLFSIHQQAMDVLSRRVQGKHIRVDGSVPANMRKICERQFQTDPEVLWWNGQMQASGVGITLTASSEIGIVEFPWRPGDLLQAESRTERVGQTNTTFINYFVAVGTIEEKLVEVLDEKYKIIATVMDGGASTEDFDIRDKFLDLLEKMA